MAADKNEPGPEGLKGLDDLYSEAILDHARGPRHEAEIADPDGAGDSVNPFCGDEAHVQIALNDGAIADLGMQTVGCSINRASGSMLAEALHGAPVAGAETLAEDFLALMMGRAIPADSRKALGQLALLEGVRQFPVRVKCALLALTAIEEAINRASS